MGDRPEESTDDRSSSTSGKHGSTESPSPADPDASVSDSPAETGADAEVAEEDATYESRGSGMRGRDVEVPMRVYKTVTVFSTLIAVVCVVGGFVVLDRATGRAQLPLSEVDPVLAILGIATILFGAAVYAFGTRFRATGMGRSKNDDDESADNG